MIPSERAGWDLSPNAFIRACRRRRDSGLPVLDLTQSNPTVVGLRYPQEPILQALADAAALRYEPAPLGLDSARRHVAAWYAARGLPVDPQQVAITASSSEAYAYLLKLLCNPGDSVLVPRPSYPLFDQLARLENVDILHYPLLADDGWRVDVDALRGAVRPNTRAVFLVSPNNPTGSFLHREELQAIEAVARDHDLALVCDEVFAEYVWWDDPERVRCAALDAAVATFSLGGLSKSAGLPQMKVGWIIAGGPQAEREDAMARLEMIADTYLSVSAPVQHALPALLDAAEGMRAQIAHRVRENLETLGRWDARASMLSAARVDAGWYVPLRVPAVIPDEAWAVRLIELDGVVVHPGSFFGFEREGTVVAGLIAPSGVFADGIDRIERRIATDLGT